METYEPHDGRMPVGSGDIAAILAYMAPDRISVDYRDQSITKTWAELAGLVPYRADPPSQAQLMGRTMEQTILRFYSNNRTMYVEPNGEAYSAAYPWMKSTPDAGACSPQDAERVRDEFPEAWEGGTVIHHVRRAVNVEAKAVMRDRPWYDISAAKAAQCMWHNQCTARGRCDLVAFFVSYTELRVYPVHRDYQVEAGMREMAWSWYRDHVIDRVPPEPDDSAVAAATLLKVYRRMVRDKPVTATHNDLELVQRWRDVREELDRLEAEKKKLSNVIRQSVLTRGGRTLIHPGTQRKLAGFTKNDRFNILKGKSSK